MILGTSRAVRVYAYPEAVDLRKGYDGLFGLVKQGLARDPLSGDLFLFVNQRRKGCKVLLWDGTGLCIFQKRLERGRFASPWRAACKEYMKRDGWKRATPAGKQVTYTCQQRTPLSVDITAQVEGTERFHVQLDVPWPISREQVETRFARDLRDDS